MDLTAADIVVSGESDSAPGSVVKFGRDKLKMDPDYQYVFFVFDKDSHENYDGALQSIRDLGRQSKCKKLRLQQLRPILVSNSGICCILSNSRNHAQQVAGSLRVKI